MEKTKMSKRTVTLPVRVHLREAGEGEESRTLEGYALKFGVRSVLMGYYYPMYEILEPGCISDEMLREQRVYFTMFHNRQIVLGRWDRGQGTLRLAVDEVGLKVVCELPRTPDGDTALELVRRGDLTEMSFIYSTDEDDSENCVSYEKTESKTDWGETIYLRHVKRILAIYDVTIAGTPAYEDTEIQAREQLVKAYAESTVPPGEDPEAAKRLEEEREARHLEAKRLRAIAGRIDLDV